MNHRLHPQNAGERIRSSDCTCYFINSMISLVKLLLEFRGPAPNIGNVDQEIQDAQRQSTLSLCS